MGMFATINGLDKCPKCGGRAEWQSKGLWLNYKGRRIWIGDYHQLDLDENMDGHIVAWGYPCEHITYYKIRKGNLIESTEENYTNYEE